MKRKLLLFISLVSIAALFCGCGTKTLNATENTDESDDEQTIESRLESLSYSCDLFYAGESISFSLSRTAGDELILDAYCFSTQGGVALTLSDIALDNKYTDKIIETADSYGMFSDEWQNTPSEKSEDEYYLEMQLNDGSKFTTSETTTLYEGVYEVEQILQTAADDIFSKFFADFGGTWTSENGGDNSTYLYISLSNSTEPFIRPGYWGETQQLQSGKICDFNCSNDTYTIGVYFPSYKISEQDGEHEGEYVQYQIIPTDNQLAIDVSTQGDMTQHRYIYDNARQHDINMDKINQLPESVWNSIDTCWISDDGDILEFYADGNTRYAYERTTAGEGRTPGKVIFFGNGGNPESFNIVVIFPECAADNEAGSLESAQVTYHTEFVTGGMMVSKNGADEKLYKISDEGIFSGKNN